MDKNIAALLDASAFTIKVMFKENASVKPKEYIYICNIPDVKVGDWVIVDAPDYDGYVGSNTTMNSIDDVINGKISVFSGVPKTVIVTQVDSEVAIEADSASRYKWVVARLDTTLYAATLQRNAEITKLVSDAYKVAMRKSFAERILGDLADESKTRLLGLLNK